MARSFASAMFSLCVAFGLGAAKAADSIDYKSIKAATEASDAQRSAREAAEATPPEAPKVERKPVNQSFGWEGGVPITTGRTAETEAERARQREQADQRFLTPQTIRRSDGATGAAVIVPDIAAPTAPAVPAAPEVPTVTLSAPGGGGQPPQVRTDEKAAASPTASRIARELADQLRARKPESAGGARFVLDEITATGKAVEGTAIDTAGR